MNCPKFTFLDFSGDLSKLCLLIFVAFGGWDGMMGVDMGGKWGAASMLVSQTRRNFVQAHTVAARQPGTILPKIVWTIFTKNFKFFLITLSDFDNKIIRHRLSPEFPKEVEEQGLGMFSKKSGSAQEKAKNRREVIFLFCSHVIKS